MSKTKALLKKLNLNESAPEGAKEALLRYVYKQAQETTPSFRSSEPVKEASPRPKAYRPKRIKPGKGQAEQQLELDLDSCGTLPTGKKVS